MPTGEVEFTAFFCNYFNEDKFLREITSAAAIHYLVYILQCHKPTNPMVLRVIVTVMRKKIL